MEPVPTRLPNATVATETPLISAYPSATPEIKPTENPPPSAPLISEVLAGIPGNNVFEFIELYNPTDQPVVLRGWTSWYQLATSEDDLLVYMWQDNPLIPPDGHYLLVQAGQDVDLLPDVEFDQGMNTTGGGLLLQDSYGSVADALGWGDGPVIFTEVSPPPALEIRSEN